MREIECYKCNGSGVIQKEDLFEDCQNCDGFGFLPAEPEQMGFVNVYTVTRHFGGHEEGGWYFNCLECIEVFPCQYQNRQPIIEWMNEQHINRKRGDIYSVLGGQDLEIRWEESPKESETREKPYYE